MWQMASVGGTLQVWIFDLQPNPLFLIAQTNSDASPQFEEQIRRIIGGRFASSELAAVPPRSV